MKQFVPFDEKTAKEGGGANFSLVEMRGPYPYCKKHGAMNKMAINKDGSAWWRCITLYPNTCRAACREVEQ